MKKDKVEKGLEDIKNLLRKWETMFLRNEARPLNFVQAAQYLSISHSHLYKLTSQRKIPFHKPSGKYLYFYKHELDEWVRCNAQLKIKNSTRLPDGQELKISEEAAEEDKSPNQVELFDDEDEDGSNEPP